MHRSIARTMTPAIIVLLLQNPVLDRFSSLLLSVSAGEVSSQELVGSRPMDARSASLGLTMPATLATGSVALVGFRSGLVGLGRGECERRQLDFADL